MKNSEFPQCPVAPCAKPMEGKECPLHVQHPQLEKNSFLVVEYVESYYILCAEVYNYNIV